MAAALNEDYQRTLHEQKKEVHELVMAGLEQIKEGKTLILCVIDWRRNTEMRQYQISTQMKRAFFT